MATQKELLLHQLSSSDHDRELLIEGIADGLDVKVASVRRRLNELVTEGKVRYENREGRIYVVLNKDGGMPELARENERLKQEIVRMVRAHQVTSYKFDGEVIRFGSLGDTQLGSMFENLVLLDAAYDVFANEGIELVLHPGDLLDGEKMYRGHEYELHTHGCDAQVAYCIEKYPVRPGIETKFILGNHDRSFWKHAGVDVGLQIERQRDDMCYLGMGEADVPLSCAFGEIIVRLSHPGKGTSYAISYQTQKYVEALTGGHKPNMLLVGHYHKQEHIFYRNIQVLQTGCFAASTHIETADGRLRIKDIRVGDYVLTHLNRFRRVTETFKRYYHGGWTRIRVGRIGGSSQLTATDEHPILTVRGGIKEFVAIADLCIGDVVFVVGTKCRHCGAAIPYYNHFCRDCNPAMEGALYKPAKRVYNRDSGAHKHLMRDILPFCKLMREFGAVIVPIDPSVIPDAVEFKDGRVIFHEVENSRRANYAKYQNSSVSDYYDEVEWHIVSELRGNTRQNWYEADSETGLVKVRVVDKEDVVRNSISVYNLEVEEDHSFIAGHVAVHNCAQHQTPFMRERNLAAMQGFYIIELTVNETGISRCKTEWMPCYD